MNDRYLYRAKRADNGELVEGYIVIYPSGRFDIHKKCMEPPDALAVYEVDPSTICQCTGLKDKNGKLIWENDIVNVKGTFYVCRFDEENVAWEFQNREETIGICCFHSSDIGIVGNIFDNTELLEVGE